MIFEPSQLHFASEFTRYIFLNPFDRRAADELRLHLLEMDLGPSEEIAHCPSKPTSEWPGIVTLLRRVEALLTRLQNRIRSGVVPGCYEEQRSLEGLLIGALFLRHFEDRQPLREAGDGTQRVPAYRQFAGDLRRWTDVPFKFSEFVRQPAHMFAVFFQVRRSVDLIGQLVRGNSRPVNGLRAEIWHSIFPHELQLYGSLLYDRMHDVTTLILGQSGTGKELVATAIGLSRYIPFDAKQERFTEPLAGAFHPVNLSAMPIDLIESEMFGHCSGAFTGAVTAREGWFERCGRGHSVFLDEIGELAPAVQVKILRVLQSREYYRVGETEARKFAGKVIAATNRDLGEEIASGRFREDLFYRLCSDVVRTPSLREQLVDCPADLPFLVRQIAEKCLGARAWPEQIDWLADLAVGWIEKSPLLGPTYAWPGNFRELEQCVRNVMVRGAYHPTKLSTSIHGSRMQSPCEPAAADNTRTALDRFIARVRASDLTFEEILEHYCSLVFARSENITEAARRLSKHRSTIQDRIKPELVDGFRFQ
ncbi:MAG: sigma 54-interacting transcriptional regulator [Planctomycetota bacterium]